MRDDAFDRIVRAHGEALSRVAWGYVDSADDHEDLMQDVLVAIWQALPRLRDAASERAFTFRIAHNRGCTFSARRRRDLSNDTLHDETAIVDPRPGPAETFDAARRREELARAVRTLPDTQRQAVLLRLEGFSLSEIAALQGTSEANVSVRLTRGSERLRALLGAQERDQ